MGMVVQNHLKPTAMGFHAYGSSWAAYIQQHLPALAGRWRGASGSMSHSPGEDTWFKGCSTAGSSTIQAKLADYAPDINSEHIN